MVREVTLTKTQKGWIWQWTGSCKAMFEFIDYVSCLIAPVEFAIRVKIFCN